MDRTKKFDILFRLGEILKSVGQKHDWPGYEIGVNEEEYKQLQELTKTVHVYNGWFTEDSILKSFTGLSKWLSKSNLESFTSSYSAPKKEKTIAIIMAGNIPLVGFHDLMCVYLSGHKALIKMSSDDDKILPQLLNIWRLFDENIDNQIQLAQGKLENFDAVIATGSDNSSSYFQDYFGKYPHIIRKHRTSVGILTGEETRDELVQLGHDIFDYYGLGCRNVSKLFVPKGYDFKDFFEAIFDFNPIIHHHKYANNYDYNKAVYLMNQVPILDNNFIMLKEDETIYSPLGVVLYEFYEDDQKLNNKLIGLKNEIQVIAGKNHVQFGAAQSPEIDDFADRIDTMEFLATLS
ncbi:MAG: acyl-CoA reductase [Crocinitomicaceae bacterium]|nr:acyl-CoA reductase [Crocinitomicaceae bacterium]